MENKPKGLGTKIAIISLVISIITFILSHDVRDWISHLIFDVVYPKLILHPFFWGVMLSWFFAVLSTFMVLLFAYINHDKKEQQYKEIFRQSERWLRRITIFVLFYIAIHLASKAFWPIGIPIFSQPYDRPNFLQYISPQDIFLSLFVLFTIIFLFLIAPYLSLHFIRRHKYTVPVSIFLIAILIAVCIILWQPPVVHVNESSTEPSMSGAYLFRLNADLEDELNKSVISVGLKNSFKTAGFELSENAMLQKKKENEWMITDKETFVTLKGATHEQENNKVFSYQKFIVRKEDTALNVYRYPPVFLFVIPLAVSLVIFICRFIFNVLGIPKGIKSDFRDLLLVFCILPAIIVASLVLVGDKLVRFPNVPGNIVVGLLLISGFAALMSIVTISFKQETVPFPLWNPVWIVSTFASLAAISFFSMVFLLIQPLLKTDIFEIALSFSVAIMIVILLYGFLYEKLQKYQFTEWWRRECRPIAMIISILLIAIVSVFDPIFLKLLLIFAVLVILFYLPWIIMGLRRLISVTWFRRLLKGQIPKLRMKLPMHQGMVLVKAKTDPGSLKEVVKEVDDMEGVYQTMVVRGDYDVCLIVEGVSSEDVAKKILNIRKIYGVASTTTLTDIREFFDREMR